MEIAPARRCELRRLTLPNLNNIHVPTLMIGTLIKTWR